MTIKKILNDFAKKYDLDLNSGGGFVPKSKTKDYEYGRGSEGILLHDGGDLAPFVNLDYCEYKLFDLFNDYLNSRGYYHEPCTCYYTAFYKL